MKSWDVRRKELCTKYNYLLLDIHGPQRSSLAIRETFIHLTALCVHHCEAFPLYSHFNVHSFYNFTLAKPFLYLSVDSWNLES